MSYYKANRLVIGYSYKSIFFNIGRSDKVAGSLVLAMVW